MEHLMDFVEVNNKWYYVSTNFTFDNGLETMVFPANEENEVTGWFGLYQELHDSIYEAVERHEYIKTHIEECIKNYEGFKSRLNL